MEVRSLNNNEELDFNTSKIQISIWAKVFKMVMKRKVYVILMAISMIALSALDIIGPIVSASAIKTFFENSDYTDQDIVRFIIYFAGIALGYAITIWGFIKLGGIVETEVAYEIRHEAFVKLQELSFSYYDKTQAGWIMARLTSDSRKLAEILSWGLVDMLWGGATMIGVLGILFVIYWPLAIIIAALVPLMFIVSMYFRKKILRDYRGVRKINSKITSSYNEGILGSKTTKTLVLEDKRNQEFSDLTNDMKTTSIKAIVNSSIFYPILIILGYVGILLIFRVGGGYFITGLISITTLYLFINYTTMFFEPISQIARLLGEFQQAQASAERIMMLIETKVDIVDEPEVARKYGTLFEPIKENWEQINGDISFENVSFRYTEKESVLEDFNLEVKAGMSVALVGATGSGKSTIVNLLCRFYEPVEGVIKIDGRNYKDRSVGWLHSNLGYVLQSPHLFKGTIMENIRYGRLDATDEEVIKAAEIVSADEFIKEFDDGYNTDVGDSGGKLSLGQRQLISFARAIVADPKILILDEATSSIDTKTEYLIQDVIARVLKGRTSFIVAHRLSTIINSDLIVVISKGRIIEKGTHRELLALEGEYYNLYRNQFINEAMERSKY
jgi:ATP-binding cassette subfamily B protein